LHSASVFEAGASRAHRHDLTHVDTGDSAGRRNPVGFRVAQAKMRELFPATMRCGASHGVDDAPDAVDCATGCAFRTGVGETEIRSWKYAERGDRRRRSQRTGRHA
jgi:hypothetical protein